MIYVLFLKGRPVHVTTESPYTGTPKLKEFPGVKYDEVKGAWDFKSFEEVQGVAKFATAMSGKSYIAFDQGSSVSTRFGLMEAPAIGDKVSEAFNGDYNPCGTIVKITKGWRVTTSDGTVFNRRRNSASWRRVGGGYNMVAGHISERNPEF